MTSPRTTLAPELEELIRTVASDPRSTLLRVERPASYRPLFDPSPDAGVRRSFLTHAERHVLDAHREEVAALLLRLCTHLYVTDAIHGNVPLRSKSAAEDFDIPTQSGVGGRYRELARISAGDAADGLKLVQRCLTGHAAVTLGQAAMASLRLRPSNDARFYGHAHLVNQRELAAAERLMRVLSSVPTRRDVRIRTLQAAGRAAYAASRHEEASRLYRGAFELDTSRFDATPCWLINAFLAGDEKSARSAASALDSGFPPDHSLVQQVAETQRRDRMRRSAGPPGRLRQRLLDHVGATSQEILHAAS